MSIDLVDAIVRPSIPADCLTQVEVWLLRRSFTTRETRYYFNFSGCWTLNDIHEGTTVSPDEELEKALAASRQICPELCAAVEREIAKNGKINSASVDYEAIFQTIIRRHPNLLDHISIKRCYFNTRHRYFDEDFTLITATAIESIGNHGTEIVHRSAPCEPEPCYIMPANEEGFY